MSGFEVEFLDAIAAQDNHPGLFRMGRVDQHFCWPLNYLFTAHSGAAQRRGQREQDEPEVSVEGRVTEPAQGAVLVRQQARAL